MEQRQAWAEQVARLIGTIKDWAEAQSWPVTSRPKVIAEESMPRLETEELEVQTPSGTIQVEPIGLAVLGARGRVDLWAWPSLNRVRLVFTEPDDWSVYTDSNVRWPKPWSKETFVELAQELAASQ